MGYADTLPFTHISTVPYGSGAGSNFIDLTNVTGDKLMGTIKTFDYNTPINYAYASVYVPYALDSSGAPNYFNQASNGYLQLDDGVSTIDCGDILNYWFMTPANSYSYNHRVPTPTNIAANINPNTNYSCTIKDALGVGNSLRLYRPTVYIDIYYVR